mmetsp:Transcript_36528/g.27093  ORF Transcript_36528/g.27093 Transcript_36528/m.27093 type:complete len:124 (+) Transcript_36528:253-624(+)
MSLGEAAENLKKASDTVKQVEFFTINGSVIPEFELVSHRKGLPLIMVLNKYSAFAVNLNENYKIGRGEVSTNLEDEEAYFDYSRGIGLPKYNSFLLSNFLNKLHHTLPYQKEFTPETIKTATY